MVSLAVLSGDRSQLPPDDHPFVRAAAAVLTGAPLPDDLPPQYVHRIELLARARRGS
ncbi:MAG: hypothetical protein R3F59_21170 [Myxococcota bacterium]